MGDGSGDSQKVWQVYFGSFFINKNILDVGSGLGLSKERLSARNNKVTTQDIKGSLERAELIIPLKEVPGIYDIVTSFDVIEHVEYDRVDFLCEKLNLCKEGILDTTPNKFIHPAPWHFTAEEFIDFYKNVSRRSGIKLKLEYFLRCHDNGKDIIIKVNKQDFIDRKDAYAFGIYAKKGETTMIKLFEIGMHNGGTTDILIDVFERAGVDYEVYGFEPAKDMWEFLLDKYKDNPKVKVFNVAVSNFDGETKLYDTPNPDGRTLCVTKWNAKKDEFESCKAIKFSEWFYDQGFSDKDSKDFYIVDCNIEGSEYEFYTDLINTKIVQYIDLFTGSLGDLYKIGKDNESIESFLSQLEGAEIVVYELDLHKIQNLDFIENSIAKQSTKSDRFIPPRKPAEPKPAIFVKPPADTWFMDMMGEEVAPVVEVKKAKKKRTKKN